MSASLDLANGRAVWTDAASSLPAAPPLGVVLLPTLRPQISGSTLDPDISVGDLSIVTIGRGDQLSGADSGYFLLAASGSELVPNDSSGVSIWSFNKNTGVGAPLDIHVPLRVPSISNGSTHLSLMGADPEPQFDWTITATGKFGAGKAPALNRMSVYDTADASKVGAQPAALGIYYTTGAGAKGGRTALLAGYLVAGEYGAPGGFALAAELRAGAIASMGGRAGAPGGQIDALSTYGIASAGATHLVNVSTEEANTSVKFGASSSLEVMKQFAGLSDDWGKVDYTIGANGGYPGFGGRVYQWWDRQTPTVDTSTAEAIAVSAGHNLPDFDYGTLIGSPIHEWPFGPTSKFLAFLQQRHPNSNHYGDTSAARPKFMSLGWGMDFWGVNIVNQAFRSSGFAIQGNGEIDVGRAAIVPSLDGLTIDPTALLGVVATEIVSGGRGFSMGDQLNGPAGDIYTVSSVVNGIITGVAQTVVGYTKVPPHNPITLIGSTVQNPTVNLTWASGKSVEVVGHMKSSGPMPRGLAACGPGSVMELGSTDIRGTINIGRDGGTSCTLNFARAYNKSPTCIVNAILGGRPVAAALRSSTTTSATFAFASPVEGGTAIYQCWE